MERVMKKFEHIGTAGQYTVASSEIYAKRLLVVQKDGVGFSKIVSGTPEDKEVQYTSIGGIGSVTFPNPLLQGEPVLVLYEDAALTCEPPVIQIGTNLPDGAVWVNYVASFTVGGTQPFTLSNEVLPAGLNVDPSNEFINFSGIPTTEETGVVVSMTITNACGSVEFSDVINVVQNRATLTFTAINTGGFNTMQARLSVPIDVTLNIFSMFADGYTSTDCSGSATASMQAHDRLIPVGGQSATGSEFPNGDWSAVNSFTIYNCIVEIAGGAGLPVFNDDIVQMGSYLVTIIFEGC
jgi:hypothetical protein